MHMHTPHLHMHMLMLMHMHMHAPPYHRANPAWPEESNSHSLRFCSAFASPQGPGAPPPPPPPAPPPRTRLPMNAPGAPVTLCRN
jgi:hypothetical protein